MRKTLIILLLFCFTGLNAQYVKPYFNTISVENGLPEGYVVSSLQDRLGYMWLGTQNGLVRYNGYELKPYSFEDENGIQIVNASIGQLHEDKSDTLWAIVSRYGLYYLDRQKDHFVNIPLDSVGRNAFRNNYFLNWVEDKKNDTHWFYTMNFSTSVPTVFTWDQMHNKFEKYSSFGEISNFMLWYNNQYLIQDAYGKIWMADDSTISYFNSSSKSFEPWFTIPEDQQGTLISGITIDPANSDRLWVSTYIPDNDITADRAGNEFYQVNTKTKKFQSFRHKKNDPGSIEGNSFFILNDSLGRTWVSTDKGISLFNPESGTFSNYDIHFPSSYSERGSGISEIVADKEGNLWMAGTFNGLIYLDIKTSKHYLFDHNETPGSLPDSPRGTNKLFYDRSGTLWVSMPWRGISYLNHQKSMLNPFLLEPSSGGANGINSEDNFYIIGKYNDSTFLVKSSSGLFKWNFKQNAFNRIELNNYLHSQIINSYITKDGMIWFGSNGAGLIAYDPEKKSVINFTNDPNDSTSISSNTINKIAEDSEGNLWIATNQGLCLFNRKASKFTRFPFITNNGTIKAGNELDDSRALSIYIDTDDIVWVGTNSGALNRYDPVANEFTSYLDPKAGFFCVVNIFEDSRQRMWNSTYLSGLFLIDKKTGEKKRYSPENGLLHNSTFGIAEDKSSSIWVSSMRGLSRLNPENGNITNFQFPIGNVMSTNPLFTDSEGWLQFVIEDGLITFDPEKFTINAVSPITVIESVSYRNYKNRDTILFADGMPELKLRYNENKLSFQYVGLHYANAESNHYAYKLEGYDTEWIEAGTQRTATYTNLSPGKYTFVVKASNSDGIWNETSSGFSIIIAPPWWQTTAAYLLYGILFIAGIIIVDRVQRKRLREKEQAQAREKELAQAKEIEKAYKELKATQTQLIQAEKMASLGELTAGIAHEIQNPLNFVNNFSEVNRELIAELREELENGNLEEVKTIAGELEQNEERISHHGKRADAIVKGMLQHSRISNGAKEPTDINALADEYLRLSYHGLRAKDKSFNADFKTDFDAELPKIAVIPQDIGRVLLNLINNAFHAVNERTLTGFETLSELNTESYKPTVIVSTKNLGDHIEISVKDNGPGIPEEIKDKIFQPFFTTKPTGEGTGLGLSMSYDIITKGHGGELKVESKTGEGSEFIIQLNN
jgi:signal transduction histidine kinase/ligand-binding sensor domain-containing protein